MDDLRTVTFGGLTQVINRFEQAWQSGKPPSIVEFLPPASNAVGHDDRLDRRAVLLELILVDFEQRWKVTGEVDTVSRAADMSGLEQSAGRIPLRPRVEHYVHAFPELGPLLENLLQLAAQEYRARHRWGDRPAHNEYMNRFPALSAQLRPLLTRIDEELGNSRRSHGTGDVREDLSATNEAEGIPQQIGRYPVTRRLGRGAFGVVYGGHHPIARRDVAIKVLRSARFSSERDAEEFLEEARTLFDWSHPGLVRVYDADRLDDGTCFVVMGLASGGSLERLTKAGPQPPVRAAELVEQMAEALHYAHQRGFVHRDVKPPNILLDADGRPLLSDFGLAVHERSLAEREGEVAGTPLYMAPEQVRGEAHRLNGSTDLWAVGVILYELLTGRRPFAGDTREELYEQIEQLNPRPPRHIDAAIPEELQRICLKCLSKRMGDRYSSGHLLAEDLRHWRLHAAGERRARPLLAGVLTDGESASVINLVPKGLRSFDEHDADFFLELLPGPRDREGLPDSLRFWKNRIEETSSGQTFSVGLIYGPSGCGKSSLVKAGLLPRLSASVIPVYLESTAAQTEQNLLKALRDRCPASPQDLDLAETIAALRRGTDIPVGQKILIVLDQFEQWLHAAQDLQQADLVKALRQCDGEHVQCITMVRDDFWMAASRFMRELEVPLEEANNSAPVDLFDLEHARKVLAAFGRAYGRLPENSADMTKDQHLFLQESAAGLATEGKVISVRLALFAEMMKSKPWTSASLKHAGGAAGVGLMFLEEAFADSAPPERRHHQEAARAVLKTLLPESGTNIRGRMRSYATLSGVAGYSNRPQEFEQVIRILGNELRLITPTDPEGTAFSERDVGAHDASGQKYFQLTHDYLVPSLRDWLHRKQRETRRGRAELRLAERAALWGAQSERRYLPSAWECLRIRLWTDPSRWTEQQRRMMRGAQRMHVARAALIAMFVLAAVLATVGVRHGVVEQQYLTRAQGLVDELINADTGQVPEIVQQLSGYKEWTHPLVAERLVREQDGSTEKLHLLLALVGEDDQHVDYLYEQLLRVDAPRFAVIRDALAPYQSRLVDRLWTELAGRNVDPGQRRLRAASALARYDPWNSAWNDAAPEVTGQLVSVNPVFVGLWQEALRPVADRLLPSLTTIFLDQNQAELPRAIATSLLADYAKDDLEMLTRCVQDADSKAFAVLLPAIEAHGTVAIEKFEAVLDRSVKPNWNDLPPDPSWTEPSAAARAAITNASGLMADRFAFCQTMPLETLVATVEELRAAGYRPVRVRPYATDSGVTVAAVWTRDSVDWRLACDRTAEDLSSICEEWQNQGYSPVDMAGYVAHGSDGPRDLFCAICACAAGEKPLVVWRLNMTKEELEKSDKEDHDQGIREITLQRFLNASGSPRWNIVRRKDERYRWCRWHDAEEDYLAARTPSHLQLDVAVSGNLRPPLPDEEADRQKVARYTEELRTKPTEALASLRGEANFRLGNFEAAIPDLTIWIDHQSGRASDNLDLRALAYARLGKRDEAKNDVELLQKYKADRSRVLRIASLVALYLGENAWSADVEEKLRSFPSDSAMRFEAARLFALASEISVNDDASAKEKLQQRAVDLLREAIGLGYDQFDKLRTENDFLPLARRPDFLAVWNATGGDRLYSTVDTRSPDYVSQQFTGLEPDAHRVHCSDLAAADWRPVAISVAQTYSQGPLVSASVWQQSVPTEAEKDALAIQQSNAAAALFRLGRSDRVWPLLRRAPDNRLRNYLIHRLPLFAVPAEALHARLAHEHDAAIKQALLLCLGEVPEASISGQIDRELAVESVANAYRSDPDPGVHSAAEFLLRRWSREDRLVLNRETEVATAATEPLRWIQGTHDHPLVVVEGPVEFWMGSHATEPRDADERLHRRRISRTFAISAKLTTVEQYLRYAPQFDYSRNISPTADCPVNSMSWYSAARYCRWLSEQEQLPEDEMCYPPVDQIKAEMRLPEDYLLRTGYRLPTEAEWEYAARAGTTTIRPFGSSEEFLPQYYHYFQNSEVRAWPAGSLKPNQFGLFGMLGGLTEWCHDVYDSYPQPKIDTVVEDSEQSHNYSEKSRVMRGASYNGLPLFMRSASRNSESPSRAFNNYGFRIARTWYGPSSLQWLGTAIAARPDDWRLRLRRAKVYADQKNWPLAEDDLNAALDKHPNVADLWNQRGRVRAGQEQWEAAVADQTEAIRHESRVDKFRLDRAAAYRRREQWKAAEDDYSAVIARAPKSIEARIGRAELLAQRGQSEQALEDYNAVLEDEKDHADWHMARGELLFNLRRWKDAFAAFDRVTSLVRKTPQAWRLKGAANLMQDIPSEYYFTTALEIDPQDIASWLGLGEVYLTTEKWEQAVDAFGRALSVDSEQTEALAGRALAMQRLGTLNQAEVDADQACQRGIVTSVGWSYLAEYQQARGEFVNALTSFGKAVSIDKGRAKFWYARGNLHFQLRDWQSAADDYERAVALNPSWFRHWYSLAESREKLRDWQGACDAFLRCTEINKENTDIWRRLGVARTWLGQWAAAEEDFSRAIALNAGDQLARLNRGIARRVLGRLDEADADLTQAAELSTQDASVWEERGRVEFARKNWAIALAHFSNAIERSPEGAEYYVLRGNTQLRLDNIQPAFADFSRAVELEPKSASHRRARALAYESLKQWDSALVDHAQAVELSPDDSQYLQSRADLLDRLERYDDALADYTQAIKLNPEKANIWNDRGYLHQRRSNWSGALADYTRATELAPQVALYWGNRAFVRNEMGAWWDAVADNVRAIELNPEESVYWHNQGYAHLKLDNHEKAIACFERAIQINERSAFTWGFLGDALFASQQFDLAYAAYSKEIEYDPKNALNWQRRAKVSVEKLQFDKAIADLDRAIELAPREASEWLRRGKAHEAQHNWDAALVDYSRTVELAPRGAEGWLRLGVARAQLGHVLDSTQALETSVSLGTNPKSAFEDHALALSAALEKQPGKPDLWFARGVSYLKLQRWDNCLADCTRALELDDKNSRVWYARGLSHLGRGEFAPAEADLSQALERDTGDPTVWGSRARARAGLGHCPEAIEDYRRMIQAGAKAEECWSAAEQSFAAATAQFPQNAKAHVALAVAMVSRGSHRAALTPLASALRLDSLLPDAWELSGDCHRQVNELQAAAADFTASLQIAPDNTSALRKRASTLADLGRLDDAVADYTLLLKLSPDGMDGWNSRGVLHSRLGQHEKARDDYSQAIQRAESNATLWSNRGRAHDQLNQAEQALADFTRSLALQPDQADTWNDRGLVYFNAQRWEEALLDFSNAVSRQPGSAVLWLNRGLAQVQLGRMDAAIADFSRCLEINSGLARAWQERAAVYARRGDSRRALNELIEATAKIPQNAGLWAQRGESESTLKLYHDAIQSYTNSLFWSPGQASTWHGRGIVQWRSGRSSQAADDLAQATELAPDVVTYRVDRGFVLRESGHAEQSLAEFDRAIEMEPKREDYLLQRARALADLGRIEAAIADANQAVELSPDQANNYAYRGGLRASANQWTEAHDDYAKALELDPDNSANWNLLAVTEVRLGRLAESAEACRRAIKASGENWLYWRNRGATFAQMERWSDALDDYAKSVELASDPQTLNEYALLLWRANEEEKIPDIVRRAVVDYSGADSPQHGESVLRLCLRSTETEAHLALMDKLARDRLVAHLDEQGTPYLSGALKFRAGEWDEALVSLSLAVREVKDEQQQVLARLFLAMTCARLGQSEQASSHLEIARDSANKLQAKPIVDAGGGRQHSWQRKLEFDWLLQHAEKTVLDAENR